MAEFDEPGKIIATPKLRGKGKLIREDLRKLPGDLVTKEHPDGSRIHELDPPHIVDKIAQDYREDPDIYTKGPRKPDPEYKLKGTITRYGQLGIDFRRINVYMATCRTIVKRNERNQFSCINYIIEQAKCPLYIWYPKDDLLSAELRKGHAPSNGSRPKWLKNKDLWVNILDFPERLYDIMLRHDDEERAGVIMHVSLKANEIARGYASEINMMVGQAIKRPNVSE